MRLKEVPLQKYSIGLDFFLFSVLQLAGISKIIFAYFTSNLCEKS